MLVSEIQLFQILKERLGEKEAQALVEFVDYRLQESNEANLKVVATKEDIKNLEIKMAENKAEILKWVVSLNLGLFIASIGAMAALLKLALH